MKGVIALIVFVACAIAVDGHAFLVSPAPRVPVTDPGTKTTDNTATWTKYTAAIPTCNGQLTGTTRKNRGTWSTNAPIQVKWSLSIPHTSTPGVEIYLKCGTGNFARKLTNYDVGVVRYGHYSYNITHPTACADGVLLWSWRSTEDGGWYMDCTDITITATANQPGLTLPEPAYPGLPDQLTAAGGGTEEEISSSSDSGAPAPAPTPAPTPAPAPPAGDAAVKFTVADVDLEEYGQTEFEADVMDELVFALDLDATRITIWSTTQNKDGSVTVVFSVSNAKKYTKKITTTTVLTKLKSADFSASAAMAGFTQAEVYTAQSGSGAPSSGGSNNAGVIAGVIIALVVVGAIAGYLFWRHCTRGGAAKMNNSNFTNLGAPAAAVTVSGPVSQPMPPSAPTGGAAAGWTKVYDENTKHHYYFNTQTSESTWTCPPGCERL